MRTTVLGLFAVVEFGRVCRVRGRSTFGRLGCEQRDPDRRLAEGSIRPRRRISAPASVAAAVSSSRLPCRQGRDPDPAAHRTDGPGRLRSRIRYLLYPVWGVLRNGRTIRVMGTIHERDLLRQGGGVPDQLLLLKDRALREVRLLESLVVFSAKQPRRTPVGQTVFSDRPGGC